MSFYKKCTAKPYSFLVADASLATDNLLRFKKTLGKQTKTIENLAENK